MVTLRNLSALGDLMVLRILILILGQIITGATLLGVMILLGVNLTEAVSLEVRMGRKKRTRKAKLRKAKTKNELALWSIGLQHTLKALAVLPHRILAEEKSMCASTSSVQTILSTRAST